jgi:hypothetical protein
MMHFKIYQLTDQPVHILQTEPSRNKSTSPSALLLASHLYSFVQSIIVQSLAPYLPQQTTFQKLVVLVRRAPAAVQPPASPPELLIDILAIFPVFAAIPAFATSTPASLDPALLAAEDLPRFGQRQSPGQSSPASALQVKYSLCPSAPGLHLQCLLQSFAILLSSLDVG